MMTQMVIRARRNSVRTTMTVISVFVLTWLPKRLTDIYAAYFTTGPMLITPWFQAILWLCISQGWINVCVYCLMNHAVRKILRRIIRKRCSCLRNYVTPGAETQDGGASSSNRQNSEGTSRTSQVRKIKVQSTAMESL